jgi:hypothetical protein
MLLVSLLIFIKLLVGDPYEIIGKWRDEMIVWCKEIRLC